MAAGGQIQEQTFDAPTTTGVSDQQNTGDIVGDGSPGVEEKEKNAEEVTYDGKEDIDGVSYDEEENPFHKTSADYSQIAFNAQHPSTSNTVTMAGPSKYVRKLDSHKQMGGQQIHQQQREGQSRKRPLSTNEERIWSGSNFLRIERTTEAEIFIRDMDSRDKASRMLEMLAVHGNFYREGESLVQSPRVKCLVQSQVEGDPAD